LVCGIQVAVIICWTLLTIHIGEFCFLINFSIILCHLDVDEGVKDANSGWQNKPVAQFKYQC